MLLNVRKTSESAIETHTLSYLFLLIVGLTSKNSTIRMQINSCEYLFIYRIQMNKVLNVVV